MPSNGMSSTSSPLLNVTLMSFWMTTQVSMDFYRDTNLVIRSESYTDLIYLEPANYRELITRSKYFIDHTLLIREICAKQYDTNGTIVWLGPDSWGKSMNLDMLRWFFEKNHTGADTVTESFFKYNQITLNDGSVEKLKSPLKISYYKEIVDEHLAKYPVIYVSFKNVVGQSYAEVERNVLKVVARAFQYHSYVIDKYKKYENIVTSARTTVDDEVKTTLTSDERNNIIWRKFQKYLHGEQFEKFDETVRLRFLSELLYEHYKKKVVILIDDHDMPIRRLVNFVTFTYEDIDKVQALVQNMLESTFDNDVLYRGVVTGVFDTPFCTGRHVFRFMAMDYKVHQYFGFNQYHANALLNLENVQPAESTWVPLWYSYVSPVFKLFTFNPKRFAKFLKTKEYEAVDHPNDTDVLIRKMVREQVIVRHDMLNLISNRVIDVSLKDTLLDYFKLQRLQAAILDEKYVRHFYDYLLGEGYIYGAPGSGKAILMDFQALHVMTNWLVSAYQFNYRVDAEALENAAHIVRAFLRSTLVNTAPLTSALETYYGSMRRDLPITMDTVHEITLAVLLRMISLAKFNMRIFTTEWKTMVTIMDHELQERTSFVVLYKCTSTIAYRLSESQRIEFSELPKDIQVQNFVGINLDHKLKISVMTYMEHRKYNLTKQDWL